ncbi:putative tRNA-intron lyase [Rosa chinensis]|uniref:tRNA-intron lyase n=1 Tax=Rosa chinensis TaxID=74649 RepID=A0A2P6PS62_ROSCH|nr:putative tRNA-intron lyase [Rosa chinensis]
MKAEEANLLESACFGVRVMENKHWFQLSMEEAFYVCHSLKCLEIVEDKCSKNDNQLWKCMESRRASFPYLYKAYSHLRMKNWVVRSGVKYGVDFVAYRHHPALVHSEYAVIVLSEEHSDGNKQLTEWLDIHCTTRLCGGVAKTLLVLYISRNGHSVDSPSSVERFTVEERTITRWKPEQCRVDDRLVQSEKGTESEQLAADIFSRCSHSTDDSEQKLNHDELSLNTMAEDGSNEEVAEKLTIMHEECLDEEYTNDHDEEEEEENHYASRATSKMQPRRSSVSKAHWDDEMGMAVVFPKGRIWRTMGISRNGKLYISIEEVLYLVEIGALLLLNGSDTSISLEDIYIQRFQMERISSCWRNLELISNSDTLVTLLRDMVFPGLRRVSRLTVNLFLLKFVLNLKRLGLSMACSMGYRLMK